MLFNAGHFGEPAINVYAQQFDQIVGGNIQALGIHIGGIRQPPNGCVCGVDLAVAALKNPLQDAAVLAVAGPEKLAVFVLPEPVHVEDPGQLGCVGVFADFEPVREVVAHVVAAEGKHRHGIAAELAYLAHNGGCSLAAGGCAKERAVLPVK